MASSTRSRSVSVTSAWWKELGVDRSDHICARDREHKPRSAALALAGGIGLDQRSIEHLAHVVDGDHLDGVENLLLDLIQITHILRGKDERLQPRSMRREQLVLDPADGKNLATQRHLACHREVPANATR